MLLCRWRWAAPTLGSAGAAHHEVPAEPSAKTPAIRWLGTDNDPAKAAAGDYGPVPELADTLLRYAQSGGLDGQLVAEGGFYQTNYAKPILFIGDGTYLEDQARAEHFGGDQWGMTNEIGQYPGQPWLIPYSFCDPKSLEVRTYESVQFPYFG